MPLFPVRRDADSAAFFDGTARDQFLLIRDKVTGEYFDPTADTSVDPGRFELVPAAGTGTVVSWSVVHGKDAEGPTRTVVGIVQLDEGPWWWGEFTDVDPAQDIAAASVTIAFVNSGDGDRDERVPQFRLIQSAAGSLTPFS
ncbi:MAG: hypothetical protein JWO18_232 [Microbacteriaceae bacterium]|jgi:uncharacterized OB-fold protein|nr:hypothetical protein [Microbacteriaceae bacterium]